MIDKEGIYSIGADEYHADPCPEPSLSASIAHILDSRSPLHAFLVHPRLGGRPTGDTNATDVGTAVHMALLDRDWSRIVFVDAKDWRTKAARQARNEARSEGRVALLAKHEKDTQMMVENAQMALSACEFSAIMQSGSAEQTIIWRAADGLWCRSRLDWLNPDAELILDYKTTTNAHPEACIRRICQLGYDLKAEFYVRAARKATGKDHTLFWLFQEVTEPYACSIIAPGEQMRLLASHRLDRAINLWRECLTTKSWPGYSRRTCWAEPPAWATYRTEDEEPIDNVRSLRKGLA